MPQPASLQQKAKPITDYSPRCANPDRGDGQACGRTLAGHLTRPWSLRCRKCGYQNQRR